MKIMEINWQPTDLKNNLVSLKPLKIDDFEPLFAIASDPKIWEQHPEKERYSLPVFQHYFNGAMASKAAFVIIDNHTGQWIGGTRFYDYEPETSSITIGFTFLVTQYWGGIYNRSVKKLMVDYALERIKRVLFDVGVDNIRSQKALGKIGAKPLPQQTTIGSVPHLLFEINLSNYSL